MAELPHRGYYPSYWADLTRLARAVLQRYEQPWMPEGEEWERIVADFARELDGAIGDRVHEWQEKMEREKAEQAMAAAEARVER